MSTLTRNSAKFLRRYTNIASTLHILQNKRLTLLSPAKWDDQNDAYFLKKFAERKQYSTMLALCFARRSETFHHWKVFTNNEDGVCIEFSYAKLMMHTKACKGALSRNIEYREVVDIRKNPPNVDDLPFIKRYPYKDEKEFRIIYCSKAEHSEGMSISIELSCINRIIINPWLHPSLFDALKETISGIDGCSKLLVRSTTLLNNKSWRDMAEER